MKKYMFLLFGFEKPTPEIMDAWQAWFESMADRIVDQGGLWGGACQITKDGTKELPLGLDSITGHLIFNAESLAEDCPIVASNRVREFRKSRRNAEITQ